MKLQYASDLHLEFNENYRKLSDFNLKPVAPYLILAGDIDVISSGNVTRTDYFKFLSDNWEQVYIIPGNHEFYDKGDVSNSFELDYQVHDNVRYLNNKKVIIEHVELFFTTLWSKVNSSLIKNLIGDFSQCLYDDDRFSFTDHDELHRRAVNWLYKELSKPKRSPRVVISHFVPDQYVNGHPIGSGVAGQLMNRYFVADLSQYLPNWNIDYWIYGHNHWDKEIDYQNIKFRSNQFGYCFKMEHTDFDYQKVIEL